MGQLKPITSSQEAASHIVQSAPLPEVDFGAIPTVCGYEEIRRHYQNYLQDESRLPDQGADYIFFPRSEAEVAAVVKWAAANGVPLTTSAARTGLVGGAVPYGGAVVSLERLNRPVDFRFDEDSGEYRLEAECAVTLREIDQWVHHKEFPRLVGGDNPETQAALARFRQDPDSFFYPPDPTEVSASLGGTVATNASGARTYRFGPTRAWVRGLRVVLANGEVLDIRRGRHFAAADRTLVIRHASGGRTVVPVPTYQMVSTKNTAGLFAAPNMDLIDLFIGSEGLFGIITRVEVALARSYPVLSVVQFVDSDEAAVGLVEDLRANDSIPPLDFLEFYDTRSLAFLRRYQQRHFKQVDMPPIPAAAAVFFELEYDPDEPPDLEPLRDLVEKRGTSLRRSWAGYERRDLARFKNFRHLLPEVINSTIAERKRRYPHLHKLGTDLAVPDEALARMWHIYRDRLERSGLEWVAFGHIGNNHIHINILPKDMEDLERGLAIYQDFARTAVALGGTVSAEHGIGKLKKKFLHLMYKPEALEEMKAVKKALDPGLLFNPGTMLDW